MLLWTICCETLNIIFICRWDFDDTLSNLVVSSSRPQSACSWTLETWNKLSASRFERLELLQWMIARWWEMMCRPGQSGWKSHGTIIDDEGVHSAVYLCSLCGIRFAYWCLSRQWSEQRTCRESDELHVSLSFFQFTELSESKYQSTLSKVAFMVHTEQINKWGTKFLSQHFTRRRWILPGRGLGCNWRCVKWEVSAD